MFEFEREPEKEFEWDPIKEADNIRYHKVNFDDASQVFFDPMRMERRDEDSSN